jgi:hypothetical protein
MLLAYRIGGTARREMRQQSLTAEHAEIAEKNREIFFSAISAVEILTSR